MKEDAKGKDKVEEKVAKLVRPIIAASQMELVDVEYKKEGGHWYLRIFIDKDGGIDLDDCQSLSEQVSDRLDESDPIPGSYLLEVSSPGLERPLKKDADFSRFAGQEITVNTYAPVNGAKTFTGKLVGLRDGSIVLEVGGQEIAIPRQQTALAHLVAKFD